jgi:serine/threonine protein kinase
MDRPSGSQGIAAPPAHSSSSLSDFVWLGQIGQGSFSSVHKVRRIRDGKIYALKRVPVSRPR